jgi:hypothetical protein
MNTKGSREARERTGSFYIPKFEKQFAGLRFFAASLRNSVVKNKRREHQSYYDTIGCYEL